MINYKILNIDDFSFDEWVDTCNRERWTLNNGEKVRESAKKAIEKSGESKKIDGKTLSVIRYILYYIV